MKARPWLSGENNQIEPNAIVGYYIFCPGCEHTHFIHTNSKFCYGKGWDFNGDVENPTFSPSLLANPDRESIRCHSFIRDGKIQFLSDCFHKLAGQTVDLPDILTPEP